MGGRLVLGLSAALIVASWLICALSYATQGGGGDAGIAVLFLVAAFLTVAAAALAISTTPSGAPGGRTLGWASVPE